jgi:DNA-binding response OmpR family regulator
MRVLVVEDEAVLADAIARGLRRDGMAVDVALDGGGALDRIGVNRYDVVVLDRDLPAVHGDKVCQTVVTEREPPRVIMLTASAAVDDRVEGLSMGADDYLPKPFAFAELVARVRALSRRSQPSVPPVLSARGITVDPARRVASRDGRFLRLTNKELGVLEVLLASEGRVVSAEELLERVWDEHADPFTNSVRVTMMRLRKKLGRPPVIETLAGAGYRL